jgi:flagellar biosynthesis anti-sigma factor FlgM
MNKIDNSENSLRIFSESRNKKEPKSTSFFQNFKENKSDLASKKKREKNSSMDAKVTIPDAIKDFAKIKKMVDESSLIDNEKKVIELRNAIKKGSYKINYDQLTDKIIENEF